MWLIALLAVSSGVAMPALASGAPEPQRVLLLYSFRHGLSAHDLQTGNAQVIRDLRAVLKSLPTNGTSLHVEYMIVSTQPEPDYFGRLANDLRSDYSGVNIDLVVAVNFRAVSFLLQHGERVFPGCAVVFCGVEKRRMRGLELPANMTGAVQDAPIAETVAAALELLPDTERILVITGTSTTDRFVESVAREELQQYEDRIEVRYTTDRSLVGLFEQVANLPEHSVVLFLTLIQSGSDRTAVPTNVVALLSEASSAPVFAILDAFLGQGIVGGDLANLTTKSQKAAQQARRILEGEKPAGIPVVELASSRLMFDSRQLQRWGIPEERLPPGSIVQFKEPSVWAAHKWRILGALALSIIQAVVIVHLLLNRRLRRRAERSLEERLKFESFAAGLGTTLCGGNSGALREQVEEWLPRLARVVSADRCALIDFTPGKSGSWTSCMWSVEGVEPLRPETFPADFPWCVSELSAGRAVQFAELDELPQEAKVDKRGFAKDDISSNLAVPLAIGGSVLGTITFDRVSTGTAWKEEEVQRVLVIADVFANALQRRRADSTLQKAFAEINQVKDQLERENCYLRKEVNVNSSHEHIIGESPAIKETLSQLEQVAGTDATVLLLGDTGTGKDLLANLIHELSDRRDRTMVRVNCAALPPTLIESELFGREKGAYTGAHGKQAGRFEVADGSTIFLDEIAELPSELQAKLLRVLQDGVFERLGSPKPIHVDVRVIAATNRDLAKAVRETRFREDLYYRLNVFPITVPPLRERGDDIPMLAWAFVEEFAKRAGKTITDVRKQDMNALRRYPWPGNVRELRNVVEHAVIITTGSTLQLEIPELGTMPEAERLSLRDVERRHVLDVLELTAWRVRGGNGAAEILGLKPSTLESRMAKLGIERPPKSPEMSG